MDTEAATAAFSLKLSLYSLAIIVALLLVAIFIRKPKESVKWLLFGAVALTVLITTVTLVASTIRLNTTSWSKGPVHWHADFEVWACDKELDLIDPQGRFSNKVGTPSRHEHNDKRLHYEGVVVNEEDATLTNFFAAMGVTLTNNSLVFPTNTVVARYDDTDLCPDGTVGDVQVFVYTVNSDNTFSQRKVDPASYAMSPHSQVPPGDCVIIEFDQTKERTDKLCQSFMVAEEIGKLKGEVNGRD